MARTFNLVDGLNFTKYVGEITLKEGILHNLSDGLRYEIGVSLDAETKEIMNVYIHPVSLKPEKSENDFVFVDADSIWGNKSKIVNEAIEAMKNRPGDWMRSPFGVLDFGEELDKLNNHPNIEKRMHFWTTYYRWIGENNGE